MTAETRTPVAEFDAYKTADGQAAAVKLRSGQRVRLEPQPDGVVVGWSVKKGVDAPLLEVVELSEPASRVRVVHDGVTNRPRVRGDRLAERVLKTSNVELVRV